MNSSAALGEAQHLGQPAATWGGRLIPARTPVCRLLIWVVIVFQSLVLVAGGAYAADNKQQAPAKASKQAAPSSPKTITHPCARHSASELNRRAKPFLSSMTIHAIRYEVDRDLIQAVITVESCYQPKALSPKQAQGLMQLIPATAKRFGLSDPYKPYQNIKGGARYLAWLSQRFDGDLEKVLAAYNAGEGKVERYQGIPPYRETQHYVHDVLAVYHKLKQHKQAQNPQAQASPSVQQTPRKKQQALSPQSKQVPAPLSTQQRQAQLKKQRVLQQQARLRQQQAQRRMQQALQQKKAAANAQGVAGRKGNAASAEPPPPAPEITIGQPPLKAVSAPQTVQQQPASAAATPAPSPREQQANATAQQSPPVEQQPLPPPRLSKPGRGGWQATKKIAPQLFKKQ